MESMHKRVIIPAGEGRAYRLDAGRHVQIVNLHGQQVVDMWALTDADQLEVMSMEHTRSCLEKLAPSAGDVLFTNQRRPILLLEADTSPGLHDTLLSACDEQRYNLLGFAGKHRNCADNFYTALRELDIRVQSIPSPLNVFENVLIGPDGRLSIRPPLSRPGDSVTFRALTKVIVVFSVCPMDIALTNGLDRTPKEIELRSD